MLQRKLIYSLLATAVALTGSYVGLAQWLDSNQGESISLFDDIRAVDKPVEGQTAVSKQAVAAKVDFSRKVVTLNDAKQADSFKVSLASIGATLVSQSDETTFVVQVAKDKLVEQTAVLESSPAVKGVDTDYPVAISADTVDWGVERVFAPKVWDKTTGKAVKVAILDTGIDATHTDLNGTVVSAYNFVADSPNVTDGHGHGTHVAGVATSVKNDSGYVGAAYEAQLLVGKVLADDGVGYLSDVIDGINWARRQGAQVINLSLGTEYDSRLLEDAIKQAVNAGVVVVAAAGNTNGGSPLYPAAYSSVISVGATTKSNGLASFSAVGATLVAPGTGITSALPGNRYASWSGTSMAAPHVSAAAALLIARGETNVRAKLFDYATDLGTAGRDATFGYGLVNVEQSVVASDTLAPLITITSPSEGQVLSGAVTLTATVSDEFGLKDVVFALDTTELARFTTGPFEYGLDTSGLADGAHTFYVTATDQNGNVGTVQVAFQIRSEIVSPTPTEPSAPTATPTATATPTESPTAELPRSDDTSPSQEVRQDTVPDNSSQFVRQDENVPVGTNFGQRETRGNSEQGKAKKNR